MRRETLFVLTLWMAFVALPAAAEHHETAAAKQPAADATQHDGMPFQRYWVKSGFDLGAWKQVTVAKVNIDHVMKMEWWEQRAGGDLRPQDLANLADYAREHFELAFTNGKNGNRLGFSAGKGPGVLRVETAIVEVVPTKVLSSVVPGVPRGTCAIEGRIVDSVSGEVLAKFADRRSAKHRIVNLDVAWNSGAKEVIRLWAADLALLLNEGSAETVNDRWDFTLSPW